MNSKMKKTAATVCLGAAVLALTPAVSMAETAVAFTDNQQATEIAPLMLYIEEAKSNLNISGTTATVTANVAGDLNDATKAKVVAELQVKNGSSWMQVETWTITENNYKAKVDETYSVSKGKTYRVKATVTIWEGSRSETQTVFSNEKTA